jgi:cytochrome P450
MLQNPLEFMVQNYRQLGPVFRVQVANRHMTILAGPEANQFFMREGDRILGSDDLFGGLAQETNTKLNLAALDGERHSHWRKILRPGYSRDAYLRNLPATLATIGTTVRDWQLQQPVPVVAAFRRLITRQLGPAIVQTESGEYFDDIWHFFNTMMQVLVMKTRPRLLLYTPRYRRAKARSFAFARQTLEWHQQTPPHARWRDLIDDMMASIDLDGQRPNEDDVMAAALGPFFAGLDTVANTCSFMLYSLLTDADLYEQVQAEVDQTLSGDTVDPQRLKQMPMLHATALETLRRYPVAFMLPRVALQPFAFGGYHFKTGDLIYVATTVTHFLPEFFPDPYTFDPQRHLAPRQEYKQTGKFAPYGLGAHTCLGAGVAEIQFMLTLGMILRTARLQRAPADYQLRSVYTPLPCPDANFGVKVVAYR